MCVCVCVCVCACVRVYVCVSVFEPNHFELDNVARASVCGCAYLCVLYVCLCAFILISMCLYGGGGVEGSVYVSVRPTAPGIFLKVLSGEKTDWPKQKTETKTDYFLKLRISFTSLPQQRQRSLSYLTS